MINPDMTQSQELYVSPLLLKASSDFMMKAAESLDYADAQNQPHNGQDVKPSRGDEDKKKKSMGERLFRGSGRSSYASESSAV